MVEKSVPLCQEYTKHTCKCQPLSACMVAHILIFDGSKSTLSIEALHAFLFWYACRSREGSSFLLRKDMEFMGLSPRLHDLPSTSP